MASVTLYPSSHTLGTNGANFLNPINLRANDGVYSTVTQTTKSITSQIYLEGFAHSIPAGSTINSIVVNVERKMSVTTSIQSVAIQAYKAAVAMGTKTTNTTEPTTDTVLSNANTGAWAYADLANLRVLLENIRGNSTVACTISYDCVSVTVNYTAPTYNFTGTLSVSQASSVVTGGKHAGNGSAQVSQASTASVSGKHGTSRQASVSQASSIVMVGLKALLSFDKTGSLAVTQGSSVVVSGKRGGKGSASISQPSSIAISGKHGTIRSLSVAQSNTVSLLGKHGAKGSVSVLQASLVSLIGSAQLPTYDYFGSLDVIQSSLVGVGGKKNIYGLSSIAQNSGVLFSGSKQSFGFVSVSQLIKVLMKSDRLYTTIVTHKSTFQKLVKASTQRQIKMVHKSMAVPHGTPSRIVVNQTYKSEVRK